MDIKRIYIKNRLFLAIGIILAGIAIHIAIHKGYQWSWMFYIGGLIIVLLTIKLYFFELEDKKRNKK